MKRERRLIRLGMCSILVNNINYICDLHYTSICIMKISPYIAMWCTIFQPVSVTLSLYYFLHNTVSSPFQIANAIAQIRSVSVSVLL